MSRFVKFIIRRYPISSAAVLIVGVPFAGWKAYLYSKPEFVPLELTTRPLPTRSFHLQALQKQQFDVLIIGGGATGAGLALDAATRGLKTALVERGDFASGTSSRSTKLIHGGVRYLEKALLHMDYEQFKMVREALQERATFLNIAPHLTFALPIMLPLYCPWWEKLWKVPYFWAGLKAYDMVALREGLMGSYWLNKQRALEEFPMLRSRDLAGALVYYDGSQNDSRMNLSLILMAARCGATTSNYTEVLSLLKDSSNNVCGARMRDCMSGAELDVRCKCVINATGSYTDRIRQMDDAKCEPICQPSSGVHIVLPGFYSPNKMGMLDPKTSDGRVIFFLPWLNHTIAGTTDQKCRVVDDPTPTEAEIEFILREIHKYLGKDSLGGKWTTYRLMAEEALNKAVDVCDLKPERPCQTRRVRVEGAKGWSPTLHIALVQDFGLEPEVAMHLSHTYGDKAIKVAKYAQLTGQRYPVIGRRLHPEYPFIEAEVIYSTHEYAMTVTDFLARRCRLAFLNAEAASDVIGRVTQLMGDHYSWSDTRRKQEREQAEQFLYKQMGLSLKTDFASTRKLDTNTLSLADRHKYEAQFNSLDHDKKGYVSLNDLRLYFKKAGQTFNEEQLREIVTEVDINHNGLVEKEEFLQLIVALRTGVVKSSRFAMAAQHSVVADEMLSWNPQIDAGLTNQSPERSGGGL